MSSPVKPPSPPKESPRRSRGRPPSAAVRRAILEAARALLSEGGPGSVTMEGVALRAGVGKPTVYRWFSDRHAVTMAALMDDDVQSANPSPGAPIAVLRAQLHTIVARFGTPTGRHITQLLAAADSESELAKAFRNHFVLSRRSEGKQLLLQALAARELHPATDIEVALDLLYGPVFFRLLLGHAPLDGAFVDTLLEHVLRGLSASSDRET